MDGGLRSKHVPQLYSPGKVFDNEEGLCHQGKGRGLFGEVKQACLQQVTGLGANETTREGAMRWVLLGAMEIGLEHR